MPAARPQELVLTLLGTYAPRDAPVWSGGLVALMGDLGFSHTASRVALGRLVRRGLIVPERDGRNVHYQLTPRCHAVLEEGDRRIFNVGQSPRVASQWTLLWHAIPDERKLERNRLARRLRFLGFGPVQDGTWIAAHALDREVATVLQELGVQRFAGVMVGKPAGSQDVAALARRAWDIDGLDRRYRGFITRFERYAGRSGALDERSAFIVRTRLVHEFRAFSSLDPELPRRVVAPPAHRRRAGRLFRQLYTTLRVPAQRHFDRAFGDM